MTDEVFAAMKRWHELMADGRYMDAWKLLRGDILRSWHDHTSMADMILHYKTGL